MEEQLSRGRHAGKYPEEQKAYLQKLAGLGTEPTKEDDVMLPSSDQLDDENKTSRTIRTRKPRSPLESLSRHLSKNKPVYITTAIIVFITIITTLIVPFFIDIKGGVSRLNTIVENIQRDMGRNETQIEKIEDKINNQQLMLQKHDTKIDIIDKQIDNIQTKPNK